MAVKYTNKENIALPLAVWLARDTYDYKVDPNYISVTTLLRPLRQIILSRRGEPVVPDVSDLVASRMGTALHDSIEMAWTSDYKASLLALGYSPKVVSRVMVNPTPEEVAAYEGAQPPILVYMEQRSYRDINGFTIGGKYDLVAEGQVEDYKSTSTFTWQKGNKDEDHKLQGSMYRWLNPDKITRDTMRVNYIFTDWSKLRAIKEANRNYPDSRVKSKILTLLTPEETKQYIIAKTTLIRRHQNTPEEDLPECTPKELWQDDPVWKYYSKPDAKKATKVFQTKEDANLHLIDKGTGVVKEVWGQAKACKYCPGFHNCTQKDRLIEEGLLKLDD